MNKSINIIIVLLMITNISFATGEDIIAAIREWEEGYGELGGDLVFEDAIVLKDGYTVAALSRTEGEFYAANVILVLLAEEGGVYIPLAYDASFDNYLPSENVFNFLKVVDRERGLFAFGYLEGSAGSGMMTKYDNYIMFRVVGDDFERLFTEYDHIYEDYYSRWYGGEDASAWSEGGVYEEMSEFELLELDGGLPEVLQISFWRENEDDPYIYFISKLYHYSPGEIDRYGVGKYVEVMGDKYLDKLEVIDDYRVKLLLGDWALWYRSDAKKAIGLYKEAAADCDDPRVRGGVDKLINELDGYLHDPAEAVALFYAGDYKGVIEEYPDSGVAREAFFRAGGFDNYHYIAENIEDHPDWALAVQLMCYDAFDLSSGNPKDARKYVDRVLKLADFSAEDKAQTCAYFGDWCKRAGDDKLAVEYYEKGFEVDPTGPFSDYCATRIALLYEDRGDESSSLEWAIKSVGWDTYGWFSHDADGIIATIEVDGSSLSELMGNDDLSFSSGDMDGDGSPELLVETRYKENDPKNSMIIGRSDNGYESLYRLPDGKYYVVYLDKGLYDRPCVFTTMVDEKDSYSDFYDYMFGYFEGDYKQLGRFYGGRESGIDENDWRGTLEVTEGSDGRIVRILEYDYIEGKRMVKEVYGEYEFDEGAGEYIER